MKTDLVPVIEVIEDKCVNCHMCISVCPVKYCIDGSGDVVGVDHNLCIGCGNCIAACTHDARQYKDDFSLFMEGLRSGEKILFIVAPAVHANFPGKAGHLLGFLKSLGVDAFFDVSFGAELTVKSYLNYAADKNPELIIAQPCPAIVSYCEIYQPELIPYLAPADSPMLHTIKMIRKFYPAFKDHKIAVLSPCLAKKREFVETGYGEYNITYKSIDKYIRDNNIKLEKYKEADFENPAAERAVLFSSPGGLLRTVARDSGAVSEHTRKIEGVDVIYHYLKTLPDSLKNGYNPLLVDCLNCEKGCNGGPGTLNRDKSIDEIEFHIEKRKEEFIKEYARKNPDRTSKTVDKVISRYWKKGLYGRKYVDRSHNLSLKHPDDRELKEIFASMLKESDKDILNCASCGYNSCEQMATAIFNGLNKVENCHLYMHKGMAKEREIILRMNGTVNEQISNVKEHIVAINDSVSNVNSSVDSQTDYLGRSVMMIEEMVKLLNQVSELSREKQTIIHSLVDVARSGEADMKETEKSISRISDAVNDINIMMELIDDVAAQTNLLSMNAAIEAAHAGDSGRGFSVVAGEIKKLAEHSAGNARNAAQTLKNITVITDKTGSQSSQTGEIIGRLAVDIRNIAEMMQEVVGRLDHMSVGSAEIMKVISQLKDKNMTVLDSSRDIHSTVDVLTSEMNNLFSVTEENRKALERLS